MNPFPARPWALAGVCVATCRPACHRRGGGALSPRSAAAAAVPARLSGARFTHKDFAPYLPPPLATVRVPIRGIGAASAGYLIARLAGQVPEPPPLMPVALVVRGSTGAG